MTGKHDTVEPLKMPLAQRLSGLFPRRSSSKKPPGTADQRSDKGPGVFGMKRQRGQMPPPRTAQGFKPLEVDVAMLEAFRLADGWLDRNNEPVKQQQQQQQPPPPPHPAGADNSSTPIADLFSNKSVFDFPLTDVPPSRAESPRRSGSVRRPYSMIEAPSPAFSGASANPASTSEAQTTHSILDRGRPVEPRDLVRKSQEAAAAAAEADKKAAAAAAAAAAAKDVKSRYGGLGAGSAKAPSVSAQISQAENFKSGTRHSMYAGVPPPNPLATNRTWTGQQPAQAPRSVSATPIDRIQTWQRSVTSNSASAPLASGPARRMSTRGTGNRLAWIKELEEKKSNSMNRDIGVLKKQVGSVSDKLAMFENRQDRSASPVPRFPPTRSNSTTSRLSSGNLESVTSAYGNTTTATPRTSIDTVRSSQRASSVMNYYDDSFREKMESIVSGFEAEKDKPTIPKLQRVTTKFVSIKPKNPSDEPQSSQPAPGPSNTEPEKVEEPQPEEVPSKVESADKIEEEAQPPQPEQAPASTESAEKIEEEVQTAQPEEIISAPESAEKVEEASSGAEQAEKADEEPEAAQPEAGPSNIESAAEGEDQAQASPANTEEEALSSQPDAGLSDVTEKVEEEAQPSQPEAGSSTIESEKGEKEL